MVIHKSIPTIFEIESKYFYIKPIASPLSNVAYTTSMYLTVLLAFERYLKVCHSNTAKNVCTLSNVKKYIMLASFMGLVYSFPRFFQRVLEYDANNECYEVKKTAFANTDDYKKMYLTWSNLVFRLIIPTISLTFFNVVTFIKVNDSFSNHIPQYEKPIAFLNGILVWSPIEILETNKCQKFWRKKSNFKNSTQWHAKIGSQLLFTPKFHCLFNIWFLWYSPVHKCSPKT